MIGRKMLNPRQAAFLKCLLLRLNSESFSVNLPSVFDAGMSCELKFE